MTSNPSALACFASASVISFPYSRPLSFSANASLVMVWCYLIALQRRSILRTVEGWMRVQLFAFARMASRSRSVLAAFACSTIPSLGFSFNMSASEPQPDQSVPLVKLPMPRTHAMPLFWTSRRHHRQTPVTVHVPPFEHRAELHLRVQRERVAAFQADKDPVAHQIVSPLDDLPPHLISSPGRSARRNFPASPSAHRVPFSRSRPSWSPSSSSRPAAAIPRAVP